MNKKQIKILIITFIVILLIVFLVFLLINGKEEIINRGENTQPITNSDNIDFNSESKIVNSLIVGQVEEKDPLELTIRMIAKNFAERYGTWSSHNKTDNFKSARIYTTSAMESKIDDFIINNEKLSEDYDGYYGVTAKALNINIINLNDSEAKVSVSIQQREILGKELEENINYLNLELELIEYNGNWLVDNAQWDS